VDLEVFNTTTLQLAQAQVGLSLHPAAQGAVMLLELGAAVAADLLWLALSGAQMFFPKALTPKRRQTSPVISPRCRAAIRRTRKS
jgi:hypothetical protein